MPKPKVEFLCAVLLVSRNPERLVAFYRDVLGLPLEVEHHGNTLAHFGCEVGDVHFAIHPVENLPGSLPHVGAVRLAFEVFELDAMLERLSAHGVTLLRAPGADAESFRIAVLADPDGNVLELTGLPPSWLEHLEHRREQGHDPLERWRAARARPSRPAPGG
jgi:catechol 2,3-dioxygenase-like lactoylglutathione lyase family enzyme